MRRRFEDDPERDADDSRRMLLFYARSLAFMAGLLPALIVLLLLGDFGGTRAVLIVFGAGCVTLALYELVRWRGAKR